MMDFHEKMKLLQEIAKNTDINSHTENAILIAWHFGNLHHKKQVDQIREKHREKGHLPLFAGIARDYIVKDILNNMKDRNLAKQIHGNL